MKPKEYDINSLDDICDVITEENKERFLIDLVLALTNYSDVMNEFRKQITNAGGLRNTEISKFAFTWIDDGGHDHLSTTITINQE